VPTTCAVKSQKQNLFTIHLERGTETYDILESCAAFFFILFFTVLEKDDADLYKNAHKIEK